MAATEPPPLEELAKYPKMTGWFGPVLLAKLLLRVIVSDLFGQYADRRLIVAALDPVLNDELVRRAQQFMPGKPNEEVWTLTPDEDGAVWVDFVADLGDGFDATYAIACLLAQETLKVDGRLTRRGQVLVMGGDEVYPNANRDAYVQKLRNPYGWAFPDPNPKLIKGPPVCAIPGNHDWYDGLVVFLAQFSRKKHLHLGGWRTHQRRSYFALQVTPKWWIWAMDAQLGDDVDQPQKDYFVAIAKAMPDDANIILCGPEPGWLYTLKKGNKSLSSLDYVGWQALKKSRRMNVPLVLSGDTHHYSRYVGTGDVAGKPFTTQFITSGGGGAFLHGTHQLAQTVDLDREKEDICWLGGRAKTLTLASDPNPANGKPPKESRYPTRAESIAMLAGNFKFVAYNPWFAVVLGVCYWLLGLVALHLGWDGIYIVFFALLAGFWAYTKKQEGGGAKVGLVSLTNAIVHTAAIFWLADCFSRLNDRWSEWLSWPVLLWLPFAAEMVVVGGLVAGTLFGIYLYISSRCFNLNHNDAFSSMRLDSHRHFLRMRIKDDEVTIYPIALDRVPSRGEWRLNDKNTGSPAPVFVSEPPLQPRLIEGPIVVRVPPRA